MGSRKNSLQRPVGKEDPVHYVGIDLHKQDLVVAVEDENGPAGKPRRIRCEDEAAIVELFEKLRPFKAVIEASASYRWLYELLSPLGAANVHPPYRVPFGVRGRRWLGSLDLGLAAAMQRDELLLRLEHYERKKAELDAGLAQLAETFPEVEALTELYGIGLYSALLIVAELGEVDRFRTDRQVGAYAGLTARVHQSGGHDYHGHITRQGSRWLRWILVQAAMKIVRKDTKLRNFYTRIRKRSSKHIARVAVARKLAGICWVRLRRWHREHAAA